MHVLLSHPHARLLKADLYARELLLDDVDHVRVEEAEEQGNHEALRRRGLCHEQSWEV